MRRAAAIILLCLCLALSGCSSGSIYSNYKEIDQLLVIQTVGIDAEPDGRIRLSISAGRLGGEPPVCLSAAADTISQARDVLQNFAPNEVLFYAHTNFVVIGEAAAKLGIGKYLDYIGRSPELRIDTPVFIVEGGRASELVLGASNENHGVTEVLESVKRDVETGGGGNVYSAADIALALEDTGAALAASLRCESVKNADPHAESGEITARSGGCAVLKDGALAGYITADETRGVNLLAGSTGIGTVDLSAGKYLISAALDGAKTRIRPDWGADGSLRKVGVDVRLTASLTELGSLFSIDRASLEALDSALSDKAEAWITSALGESKTFSADFAGIGGAVRRSAPRRFEKIPGGFASALPGLEFDVKVSASVSRTFDLEDPARENGGGA